MGEPQPPGYGGHGHSQGQWSPAYSQRSPSYNQRRPSYNQRSPSYNQRSPSYGQHSPPQKHPDSHDLGIYESIQQPTPRSPNHPRDAYFLPPPPPHEPPYYPPGSPTGYTAPEVAEPFEPGWPHYSRPLSPSTATGGGSTLVSPAIPPFNLNEHKAEPVSRTASVPPHEEPRRCGMTRRRFWIVLIATAILLVAIGLGVGLGISLGMKKDKAPTPKVDPYCQSHPELCIGGALDERFYSTKGAFNGSGIALAGESWNKGQRKIFTLYFQHWTGDIRFMEYGTDQKWGGGRRQETIATDAKNSTPISAVAFALNNTQVVHLFYISKNNTLRQMRQTNVSNIWEEGYLNKLNLKVYDSPSVGLQGCWKGNYYGDSDFAKFPTANGVENKVPFSQDKGINLWYPTDENTFQQYAWFEGTEDWVQLDKWTGKNAHAGVGCYSWGEGTTTYAMMLNSDNATEFWWKDTNKTAPVSSEAHPINSWKNSTNGAIGEVYPSSSFGFTTYFYAQMKDKTVKGFNITYAAENTTVVDSFAVTDPAGPVPGLGGTHLTVTAYEEKDGDTVKWGSLYVFYQTEGDDITAFTRPIKGGQWTKASLNIPDE